MNKWTFFFKKLFDKKYRNLPGDTSMPLIVRIRSLQYPISVYEDGSNLAQGEITHFKFVESDKKGINEKIGQQVVGMDTEGSKSYDCIWRHLGGDWYKLISKCYSPWTGQ